jgi:two-component system, NtrC family, response regulator HydG
MQRNAPDDVATLRRAADPAAAIAFVVTVIDGPDRGRSVELATGTGGRVLIGKSPTCGLVLTDPMVSRRHAALETDGFRLDLSDLGSTNGTFVNDVALERVHLAGGESVRVGSSTLRVELRKSTEPAAPQASGFGRLVGTSARMGAVYALAQRLAASDVPVILEGDTGTGKELLAECLHEQSARAAGPFVVFDATATPSAQSMAVLFGERGGSPGAFELANGGTLFLDEIDAINLETQGALLRAVERGEIRRIGEHAWTHVNVRTIASTRSNLDKLVEGQKFREDLYYRLVVGRIELPPLRRRAGDVPLLAAHFWRQLTGTPNVPPSFFERYEGYEWPGNVRELGNALARLVALGPAASLAPSRQTPARAVPGELSNEPFAEVLAADLAFPQARQRILDAFERAYVERVLAQHGGNVMRAAAASGIARRYFQLIRARQAR